MSFFQMGFRFSFLLLVAVSFSCNRSVKWQGQAPIRVVATKTLPIQKQYKRQFDLGNGIYATNDFEGARLNGAVLTDDTLVTALITPENTPINPSPWYAFKIWADKDQKISLKLTYLNGTIHRYYPKISKDGLNWVNVAQSNYFPGPVETNTDSRAMPKYVTIKLDIGPDTLWVAAQEIITSKHIHQWIEGLSKRSYITTKEIGKSLEGRPIHSLKIGESDDKKMIFVLSRQHPPEVTGFLAMQAFVEAIATESELAKKFRQKYNTYVVPYANPDGVDNGHWRHSTAGIDMNRDWKNVNQPEVAAIQKFMKEKEAANNGKFYFAVDFHSTWEDIYYTINTELKGNMPGLVPKMIEEMSKALELDPNIRPGQSIERSPTSSGYFFHVHGAESLTYEIGDDTPRDLLKRKGTVSAEKLMEILNNE